MEKKSLATVVLTLVLVVGTLFLVKTFNIYYPIKVTTSSTASELSVVGEGKVDVTPDTTYVDAGISVANAATVQEAQDQINKTNNAIVAAMKGLGISKSDITTSNYSIYPNQTYDGPIARTTGYSGNVTITIKIKGTELASKVVEAATQAGANQIQGTRFVVENPEKYREAARTKAIANAKEQAQKLAKDLGIKLGGVVNIVEYTPDTAVPMMYDAMAMKSSGGGGGGPQFEAGNQSITSVVTLYFEKR